MGYPLKADAFGGGFLYGMKGNQVAVGHLTSLDYSDPFFDPHREFQKFKLHPLVSGILKDGKLVQYGAKTAPVGGLLLGARADLPGRHDHRRRRQPVQRPEDQGHRPGHAVRACWPRRPSSRPCWTTMSPTRGWPATRRPWPRPPR